MSLCYESPLLFAFLAGVNFLYVLFNVEVKCYVLVLISQQVL